MIGRLPGPMAAKLLQGKGVSVIKIENEDKPDPFSVQIDDFLSPMFNYWYEQLKSEKTCFTIKEAEPLEIKDITDLMSEYDEFIFLTSNGKCSLPLTKKYLKNYILKNHKNFQEIKIASDQSNTPLHDLDLAGKIGLLDKNSSGPLKYPVMGVQFASQLAIKCLSVECQNGDDTIYFEREIIETYSLISHESNNAPIRGHVLGYNIYALKDAKIILTAMEKRTWANFISQLEINLKVKDRFSKSNTNEYGVLSNALEKISQKEIEQLVPEGVLRCFTII